MTYASIDAIQNVLAADVFHYTRDAKKAAGRAIGTLVEIVTFHLLKAWELERHTLIERRIPEYGNPDLTHNVEFTLHPSRDIAAINLGDSDLPFTANKMRRRAGIGERWNERGLKSTQLLSRRHLLRNSCVMYEYGDDLFAAFLGERVGSEWEISIRSFLAHPLALFECKRVGVEEGMRKGPQTIEKAKQGAYVARTVSALQKIRMADGSVYGALPMPDNSLMFEPYHEMLGAIMRSEDPELLQRFILTVGVVSNHGNWFTSGDHNKELRVLAQSYDWLIFLTDDGLSRFIHDLLLDPVEGCEPAREAFAGSYTGERGGNRFTKVQMLLAADIAIRGYFAERLTKIEEDWFNVISPSASSVSVLKQELDSLMQKSWQGGSE